MEIGLIISLGIVIFSIFYIVMLYNGLVSLKHSVSKHLANIDVLLKQRHDELPKLIETCKQYMKHEQETLTKVIAARQQVSVAQSNHDMVALGQAETGMRAAMGQLFALAENYPDLKADSSFTALQERISALENAIADRREVYNEAVNNNNVRIEQFPDVIIARWFRFKAFDLLKFKKEELRDVNVKSLFD
ncbi:LemA family protein [Zhongshania guokunii]|uniref:LemA family protein n=1 Tax=Zhongshania guokunii TaxID=641783 RepID=A0ABV3U4Y0_9GAMM